MTQPSKKVSETAMRNPYDVITTYSDSSAHADQADASGKISNSGVGRGEYGCWTDQAGATSPIAGSAASQAISFKSNKSSAQTLRDNRE